MTNVLKKPLIVACPHCHTPVEWAPRNNYKPFCSKRCRLMDLGEWLDEGYRLTEDNNLPLDTLNHQQSH